jgi:hypothetical protein
MVGTALVGHAKIRRLIKAAKRGHRRPHPDEAVEVWCPLSAGLTWARGRPPSQPAPSGLLFRLAPAKSNEASRLRTTWTYCSATLFNNTIPIAEIHALRWNKMAVTDFPITPIGEFLMQLLNTNVASTTDGTITVEFHGEGNELVSVRMAKDATMSDDDAIKHAKQMMVQLTAFSDETVSHSVQGEGASINDTLSAEVNGSLSET